MKKVYEPCKLCQGEGRVGVYSEGIITPAPREPAYYKVCDICGGSGQGAIKEIHIDHFPMEDEGLSVQLVGLRHGDQIAFKIPEDPDNKTVQIFVKNDTIQTDG